MVVCFIGDSLTQGVGDGLALGWVGRLAQECFAAAPDRHQAYTLCNLGLRGDTSLRIRARWRAEADRRRRPGEDMAFVFSFGAADGKHGVPGAETLAASRAILAEAAGLGRTLYIAPPPAHDPEWSAHIRNVGRQVSAICAELGVPACDFHAPLAASAAYMASLARDGIHPDAAGYAEMAAILRAWPPLMELLGL